MQNWKALGGPGGEERDYRQGKERISSSSRKVKKKKCRCEDKFCLFCSLGKENLVSRNPSPSH